MITDDKCELVQLKQQTDLKAPEEQVGCEDGADGFLPYTAFMKFASTHILTNSPFCCGNMPELGSDQHHSRVSIRKATSVSQLGVRQDFIKKTELTRANINSSVLRNRAALSVSTGRLESNHIFFRNKYRMRSKASKVLSRNNT